MTTQPQTLGELLGLVAEPCPLPAALPRRELPVVTITIDGPVGPGGRVALQIGRLLKSHGFEFEYQGDHPSHSKFMRTLIDLGEDLPGKPEQVKYLILDRS